MAQETHHGPNQTQKRAKVFGSQKQSVEERHERNKALLILKDNSSLLRVGSFFGVLNKN